MKRALVGAVLVTIMACGGAPRDGATTATTAVDIGVPGRANAHASLAASGDFLVLAWAGAEVGGAADVFAAVSRDGGASFADPVRVNSDAGMARVGGEQPPRIALDTARPGDPAMTVIWTGKGERGTTLMTARSDDGGRTFSPAALVPGTDSAGNRGWESLSAFPDGPNVSAWLDHRQLADEASSGAAHQHHATGTAGPEDGVAMAQRSQLYFAALGEVEPRPLTGGVCYCCKTAIGVGAFGVAGSVAIAWRHVYPGNLRDIAFTWSPDRGRTFGEPVRVSEDQWSIAGCPDDGPSMAVDGAGRLHLVWPTVVNETGEPVKALFHTLTSDGAVFTARLRLPSEGQANHPQVVATPGGSLVAVWDESGSGTRRVAVARGGLDARGVPAFTRDTVITGAPGVYPALVSAGTQVVAAWTTGPPEASRIHVVRLP